MTRKSFVLIAALVVASVVIVGSIAPGLRGAAMMSDTARTLVVPKLSMRAEIGKAAYDGVCAACHGADGAGTDKGPSFVHPIYNPGHHADEAFFRAAHDGVRAHHWRFGDMPAQPEVSDQKIAAIVLYVRELQRANGIVRQEHRM